MTSKDGLKVSLLGRVVTRLMTLPRVKSQPCVEENLNKKAVLFVGQAYYNSWLISRELRHRGWRSELINIDLNPANQMFYWGEDSMLPSGIKERAELYIDSITNFSIFHFANRGGIRFINCGSHTLSPAKTFLRDSIFYIFTILIRIFVWNPKIIRLFLTTLKLGKIEKDKFHFTDHKFINRFFEHYIYKLPLHWDIRLLKPLGVKVVYANNGCHDGVTPTSFSKWGPYNVCNICVNYKTPSCTDEAGHQWGQFRNKVSDFQILLGGNRADYNITTKAHEVPEFYCLDEDHWVPRLEIPEKYKLPFSSDTIKLYHSVANFDSRTKNGVNIKSSHIYFPLIDELKSLGYKIEIVFCKGIPNRDVRFVMGQCDIVIDMLTFGWFGANIREAMMLGVPSICYIRPEWLEDMKKEIPKYAEDLPIVSATPETIRETLLKLIQDAALRKEIGKKSREFALRWHSKKAGADRFEKIYSELVR